MINFGNIFGRKELLGALDLPDKRDYTPVKMFGSSANYPKPIRAKGKPVHLGAGIYALNQKGNTCTSQALTAGMQIMFTLGQDFGKTNDNYIGVTDRKPLDLWATQKIKYDGTEGTANDAYGDYLQNALKTALKVGVPMLVGSKILIVRLKSYARIQTDKVEYWTRRGHPVFTGSKWIVGKLGSKSRSYDANGFLFERENGKDTGGHAYLLVKSENESITMINSHGERWGVFKDGTALLSPQKQKELMSKYIFDLDWDFINRQMTDDNYRQEILKIYEESRK